MRGYWLTMAGLFAAVPAQAEVMVDLFAGRSFPDARRASIRTDEVRVDDVIVPLNVRIDIDRLRLTNSSLFGARLGYWHGALGVAIDASTLDPDVRRQTIRASGAVRFDEDVFGERVTIDPGASVNVAIPRITVPTTATFAALGMVRKPTGTVRPYAFAGPVYLVTDSDISGEWGLRAGGGVRVALNRTIGLFGEYRYTHADARADAGRVGGSARNVSARTGIIEADVRLRNHSAVGGVSFAF